MFLIIGSPWGTYGKANRRVPWGKRAFSEPGLSKVLQGDPQARAHTQAQASTHELPSAKATRCPNHAQARESKPVNPGQDLPPGRSGPGVPLLPPQAATTWMGEGGKAP